MERQSERLRRLSQTLPYPETPDIASAVSQRLEEETSLAAFLHRRLTWAAAPALLLVLILMSVPSVRAQVLEFLQIGAVRIFTVETTWTPAATPQDTPVPFPSLANLAGETSLQAARREAAFPIRLPDYPPDLGPPDRVFLQELGGCAVLLVWLDHAQQSRIRLSLLLLGPGASLQKGAPAVLEETTVSGNPAVWTEGAHFLHLGGSMYQEVPLVAQGNILVWEQEGITYRLETDRPLSEALRIAESLAP
jgi:hypothetical protein